MGAVRTDGTRITRAAFPATTVIDGDPLLEVTEDVFVQNPYPNSREVETSVLARRGQRLRRSEIDRIFPRATITSIQPSTGAIAGGTVVSVRGTNLDGAAGVTFGGRAGTAMTVVSPGEIRVTTPAAAVTTGPSTVDVVVADDSGDASLVRGYNYA